MCEREITLDLSTMKTYVQVEQEELEQSIGLLKRVYEQVKAASFIAGNSVPVLLAYHENATDRESEIIEFIGDVLSQMITKLANVERVIAGEM